MDALFPNRARHAQRHVRRKQRDAGARVLDVIVPLCIAGDESLPKKQAGPGGAESVPAEKRLNAGAEDPAKNPDCLREAGGEYRCTYAGGPRRGSLSDPAACQFAWLVSDG